MPTMQPQIEILELTDLFLGTYDGLVDREKFERWVDSNYLREYTTGENGGVYTWEEYYDGGGAEIDLYKYINRPIYMQMTGRGNRIHTLPDMQNSLHKLGFNL